MYLIASIYHAQTFMLYITILFLELAVEDTNVFKCFNAIML